MALQSEVSPPIVGDPNKVTQIDGDTKSEDDSCSSTEDEVDLEDGEILDSGAEEEKEKDFSNVSLKEALDQSCLQNIEQLVNQAKAAKVVSPEQTKLPSPHKLNKMPRKYVDHDRVGNTSSDEDGWFPPSPKYKHKSKFDDKPIDYRMELAAYRGTPPSSPDRKRDEKSRRKRSSKKSKKSRKTIKRRDIKGQRVARYKKEAMKGKICRFFKEGKCAKGSDCMYSHTSPSFKKKEICKFYLNGHCNKGKDCLFMHNEFPCKFYHTGSECYAKDDCRFSHAPLTDEMKRVLADYLRMSHGDDYRHRLEDRDREEQFNRERDREKKRRLSRSPEPKAPPSKRTCLLGSPPRHIREAEETKRWQEEMKLLQKESHPSFEIRLSPNPEEMSPTFQKPNFYKETLLKTPSPKRKPSNMDGSNSFLSNESEDYLGDKEESKVYIYENDELIEIDVPSMKQEAMEENPPYLWNNNVHAMPGPEENDVKPFNENSQQEPDFTSDVKFDETTQFSEMESSTDCPPNLSPDLSVLPSPRLENLPNKPIKIEEEDSQTLEKQDQPQPPAKPIVIPSHLPRKQQELFMRVLQHQRKTNENPGQENSDSEAKKEECEEEVEESPKVPSVVKEEWYTSEDEDESDDDNIRNLLKKIQQVPPKPQESKPSGRVDLLAMLHNVKQKTSDINKGLSITQQHSSFWQNILGNAPPLQTVSPPASMIAPAPFEGKRRPLLPDPIVKTEPTVPAIKDPRLKNRDPRQLPREPNSSVNIPKQNLIDIKNEINITNSPTIDITPAKPLATVEPLKETIPYRLRGISPTPLNYTPYIHASQSNPSLLKDPRLRKHMHANTMQNSDPIIGNGKDHDITEDTPPLPPPPPPKDIPPIPELLLKYEKPVSAINIFESSSSKPPEEKPKDLKSSIVPLPAPYDPRAKRRDSQSNSGSDTPPHLTIIDTIRSPPHEEFKSAPVLENALMEPLVPKKSSPPILEKSWTPPILDKNWVVEVKKEIEDSSDSNSNSNPEPPILEVGKFPKKSLSPPIKEEFMAIMKTDIPLDTSGDARPVVPPLIIKKVRHALPASHLPRAIADPRMATLHNPRRQRLVASDSNSKSIVERKKQSSETNNDKSKSTEVTDNVPMNEDKTKPAKEDKPKAKSIPKKRRLSDKSEEKKKTVHRNRKSSMDYASPLNSCDTTNTSLDYNRYNQRPKRNCTLSIKNSPSTVTISSSDSSSIPEFVLSDSSNLEGDSNSNDVNLKDRFKTIDPTASPFC